jgi:hypothetical protein
MKSDHDVMQQVLDAIANMSVISAGRLQREDIYALASAATALREALAQSESQVGVGTDKPRNTTSTNCSPEILREALAQPAGKPELPCSLEAPAPANNFWTNTERVAILKYVGAMTAWARAQALEDAIGVAKQYSVQGLSTVVDGIVAALESLK